MNFRGPETTPASKSEWPFRYFVALCITMKPMLAGVHSTGVAKVLSTTGVRLCFLQKAATAVRSAT